MKSKDTCSSSWPNGLTQFEREQLPLQKAGGSSNVLRGEPCFSKDKKVKGMFKEERVRGLSPWLSGRSLEATVGKGLRNWKRGEMGQKGVCTEPCGNQPGRPKFPVLTWMGIKGVMRFSLWSKVERNSWK